MLYKGATNDINAWMNDVIVMEKNGTRVSGSYDGYGRVTSDSLGMTYSINWETGKPDCWHRACWIADGCPEYECESPHAHDQGFFFDEGDHDMVEPSKET